MNTKRIQDAEKLVKKGEEHLKTGLFKWSPDIDSAIECFDKGKIHSNPIHHFKGSWCTCNSVSTKIELLIVLLKRYCRCTNFL